MFKNSFEFSGMKKLVCLTLMFSVLPNLGFSQTGQTRDKDDRRQAIETRRIAFFTDRMALTPDEARVFWPLYNEYTRNRDEINATYRDRWAGVERVSALSAEDAGRFAEDQIARLEKLIELKRSFHENLKRTLSPVKIALMYEADRDFNRILIKEAREERSRRR
jgi:hypothetical protein